MQFNQYCVALWIVNHDAYTYILACLIITEAGGLEGRVACSMRAPLVLDTKMMTCKATKEEPHPPPTIPRSSHRRCPSTAFNHISSGGTIAMLQLNTYSVHVIQGVGRTEILEQLSSP